MIFDDIVPLYLMEKFIIIRSCFNGTTLIVKLQGYSEIIIIRLYQKYGFDFFK